MKPEALILIEDDLDAQKLVVAWPRVNLEGLDDDAILADEDESLHRAWGRLAGVPLGNVRRLFPVLLENDICKLDGTIDKLAEQFVRKRIVDGLK